MAYENVNFKYGNFCIGPQSGTFASIDQSNVTTILTIKNSSGGLIGNYTLSSNIVNDVIGIEYVGPVNLSSVLDDLIFFTAERVSSTICIIKRWETTTSTSTLDLKQQFVKSTTGSYYYDALGMSVEHYRRAFADHNPGGINTLEISAPSRLSTGDVLLLGPSTDTDNPGVIEYVTVSNVVGSTVYLTSNITYQYVSGDPITFYNNIYLFSALGWGGDTSRGSLFKIDAYSGATLSLNTGGMYQHVVGSKWCDTASAVTAICPHNMVFVRPYDSYLNWKSLFMNNVEDNDYEPFLVYDVAFDGYNVYKLMKKVTLRDDDGNRTTYSWTNYNFRQDTLLPYSNSLNMYSGKSMMVGQNDTTDIMLKLVDQFGVALSSVDVTVSVDSGDIAAVLDPVDGLVTTDVNGEASVGYTSGTTYDGLTTLKCKAAGGSSFTGSEWVWNSMLIDSNIDSPDMGMGDSEDHLSFFQLKEISADGYGREIDDEIQVDFKTFNKTYFTSPGGDWICSPPDSPTCSGNEQPPMPFVVGTTVYEGLYYDTYIPRIVNNGPPLPNRITQVNEFQTQKSLRSLKNFKSINLNDDGDPIEGEPYIALTSISGVESDLQASQLKLSLHTYWVGGVAYTELFTNVLMDQFVFVEEAIPVFWSEKNPVNTNIWIRMRPFAFSLNPDTLKFYVREISYDGNTGWIDRASEVTKTTFDAGGGLLGLEVLYNPAEDFHYNGVVYVHIEIYDTAATPNFIEVSYWFSIIPDYRFPYLENLSPSRDQTEVAVDSPIYFEVKDQGVGVDIDSLEMTLNSQIVVPTNIVKVNDYHYQVTYTPAENLFFGKTYSVGVVVSDLSDNENTLNDRYRFYTALSEDVWFTEFNPALCKRGLPRFQEVSFLALGNSSGVDRETLRLQVRNKDVTDKSNVVPVVYRVS